MKLKLLIAACFAATLSCSQANAQATILPPGESCFSALAPTSGGPGATGTGFVGLLGAITAGSGGTAGSYGGISLTGGTGVGATANIVVSGGGVTSVSILNPGSGYVAGDVLSASSASIGNVSGFSVGVSSVALNYALAGGSVSFYIPSTLTFKQTWQDSGQTILNQNPVPLDANGCAVIYGAGIYRQILKDSFGNTVWDKLTASTGPSGIFWAGTATGGTGNAIQIADSGFANQDGATIQFRAINANSGPTTISVSGGPPISVVRDNATGPAALSGGEIGVGNTPIITYDAVASEFHIVNPSATASSGGGSATLVPPQGYLNLVGQASGGVVQVSDVISATILYYSPFVGSIAPIFNGTTFVNTQFSELTLTLTGAGSPAGAIQDACVFSNNGIPTLVLGPSWTTTTAGAGNRGTGPGTAQLSKLQGIWVNAVAITGYNGGASYSIPASQCTYVGSVYIDATAGQVTAHRTVGQNRKFGVWNAYNRQTILLQVADPTASWVYNSTIRASNNAPAAYVFSSFNVGSGTTCNGGVIFAGLPEEEVNVRFEQVGTFNVSSSASSGRILIGFNSISSGSGKVGSGGFPSPVTPAIQMNAEMVAESPGFPTLGLLVFVGLEVGNGTTPTFNGTSGNMLLIATYRG